MNMDPDLYDEFGNYVGPDLESEDDSDSDAEQEQEEEEEGPPGEDDMEQDGEEEGGQSMAIVLHEDKK